MSKEISSPSPKKALRPFFRPTAYNEYHAKSADEEGSSKGSTRIRIKRPPGAMSTRGTATAAKPATTAKTATHCDTTPLQKPSAKKLFFQIPSTSIPEPAQARASEAAAAAAATGRPLRETVPEPAWPDKVLFQGGHIGAERPMYSPFTPRPHRQRGSNCIQEIIAAEGGSIFSSFGIHPTVRKQKRRRRSCDNAAQITNAEIQAFMQAIYPSYIHSMACKTLLNSILSGSVAVKERSRTLPWADMYRPDHVEALLGNRQDTLYLRDWLLQMKVLSPAAAEQIRIERAHHGKKKRKDLFENIPVDDDADDDFMPTSRARVRPKAAPSEKMHSNLLLIAGKHGIGKTAAVYTAAEEAGYKVFEIYPGVKRAGKDLIGSVGEMTESHLVTFESGGKVEPKKRKRDGAEPTCSGSANFMRQFTKQNRQEPSPPPSQQQQQQQQPKQSLVLLEEVDILYEDDKGFWPAVTELALKSKRPIVMTCNDLSVVPLDQLFLQAILMLEPPPEQEMLAYLQLVCFNEGYFVHPADLAGLFAMIGDDLRQMIATLQLLCVQPERGEIDPLDEGRAMFYRTPRLFESFTTINDLSRRESLMRLSQLQHSSLKTGIDLVEFYNNYSPPVWKHTEDGGQDTLSDILGALDTAVLCDLLQEREEHEIDEYGPTTTDRLLGYKSLWETPADTHHSSFGNDSSSRIWAANYEQVHNKEWLRTTVWDQLLENRLDTAGDCMIASRSLLPLRAAISEGCVMADYMPHIRSMCLYDQGVVGRKRALRSRRQRHYLDLTAEQRQILLEPIQYKDITALWCNDLNKTCLPRERSFLK